MTEFLRDAEGRELDRIHLLGVTAVGHHGVFPEERRDGQPFTADVVLHLDTRPAAATDDLARTVDYGALAGAIVGVLAGPPVDLIETLAQRIADVALVRPEVAVVDVVVHKPRAPIPVPFSDVRVAVRRRRGDAPHAADPLAVRPAGEVSVVLALGANLGEPRATLRAAVADLRAVAGLRITGVSPLALTAAVGPAQPDYLNAVVTGRTTLSPRELHAATTAIEEAHGRVRAQRWGPRTLDVDVVAYGDLRSADPSLTLPHPRARDRAFVLVPWAALDPEAVLPGPAGGRVTDLARQAADAAGIRRLERDWLG